MSVMHRVIGHPSIRAQVMQYEQQLQQYYNLIDIQDLGLRNQMRHKIVANMKTIKYQVCGQIDDKYWELKREQNSRNARCEQH